MVSVEDKGHWGRSQGSEGPGHWIGFFLWTLKWPQIMTGAVAKSVTVNQALELQGKKGITQESAMTTTRRGNEKNSPMFWGGFSGRNCGFKVAQGARKTTSLPHSPVTWEGWRETSTIWGELWGNQVNQGSLRIAILTGWFGNPRESLKLVRDSRIPN